MKIRASLLLILTTFSTIGASAQDTHSILGTGYSSSNYSSSSDTTSTKIWGRREAHKTTPIPIGVSQWRVDELTGDSLAAANMDTVVHNFQFWNMTEGERGEYTILGNLGSPRLSRLFLHRDTYTDNLLFLQQYDYFLNGQDGFRFSNTKSPLTNLAYHKMGNRTYGSERFRAYFASNINKHSGIGFKVDYIYGRGQYMNQQNSMVDATFFGYHLGERYQLHSYIDLNHNKMAENGGLENDTYITDPESLADSYNSRDMPTNIDETWNRNDAETYFLTHRYRLGYYRDVEVPDSLKPQMPKDFELLAELPDSLQRALLTDSLQRAQWVDSLQRRWQEAQIPPQEFVPVGALGHTFKARTLRHRLYSYCTDNASFYTNHYYGDATNVEDLTTALEIENTLFASVLEGFSKWAAMGISVFATHHFESYKLPELVLTDSVRNKRYTRNKIYVGARLTRQQGTLLHYDILGRLVAAGNSSSMGEFDVDGRINLNFPLGRRDTIQLEAHGFVKNQLPSFYLQHYHNQFVWWDNDLSKEFRTRIEGTLTNKRTRTSITVGVENIKNYAYLATKNTLTGSDATSTLAADYSHAVESRQYDGSVQVFAVGIKQNFQIGRPLHWDNELWYQTSSKQDILPLPKINIWSNLYLNFKIAHVLSVQLGGDIRWFTEYYAPDYSALVNQYAVQDTDNPRTKIGNYPIINVYANLHLKRCRLYVVCRHVNSGEGNMFWAPHYAMDPRAIHFGVSWNFFN